MNATPLSFAAIILCSTQHTMAAVTRATSSTTHTATHTYSREETEAYCNHINEALGNHPKLVDVLPLTLNNMFQKLADGKVLWCAVCPRQPPFAPFFCPSRC